MLLYHHTTMKIWEETVSSGKFRTDGRKVLRDFLPPYRWLAGKMAEKIGPPPKGVRYPVWAWRSWRGKERPDLRFGGHLEKGAQGVQLELDIPDDRVLLSDFDGWHFVLNGNYLSFCEEEWDAAIGAGRDTVVKSWDGIFLLNRFGKNPEWFGEERSVQGTFWELTTDMVTEVRPFVSR